MSAERQNFSHWNLWLGSARRRWCWWTCRWARVSGGARTLSTPHPAYTPTPPLHTRPNLHPPAHSLTSSATGMKVGTLPVHYCRVADPHHFNADPDPVHFFLWIWIRIQVFTSMRIRSIFFTFMWIRIQLFTLMRIRIQVFTSLRNQIRILFLIEVCESAATDLTTLQSSMSNLRASIASVQGLPRLHFEPPEFWLERGSDPAFYSPTHPPHLETADFLMLFEPSGDGYSLMCSKKQPPRHNLVFEFSTNVGPGFANIPNGCRSAVLLLNTVMHREWFIRRKYVTRPCNHHWLGPLKWPKSVVVPEFFPPSKFYHPEKPVSTPGYFIP